MAGRSSTLRRLQGYASFAVDTFLLRRERPYLFILVINDECNLNCFYCATKNMGHYDLDRDQAYAALSEAYDRGHRALVITGGEPMLWKSEGAVLDDVVSWARALGYLDIAIFTNGTFPLTLKRVSFVVTVDGTREAHNSIRAGTYDMILEHVREASSPVIASVTLSKANAQDLRVAVCEIADTHLFKGITFNLLTHRPDFLARHGLFGEERIQILDRIWRLKDAGFPIILSKSAYSALRSNNWKRPIRQIELFAGQRVFTCCRDVENPEVCRNCGYSTCVEISQALEGKPSAVLELMRAK
jgi:sulfatase maturation enzyme AslB (radical SAM superfamily)